MFNLLNKQVEACSRETFQCGTCKREFEAAIITWIDVSKTPRARHALLNWQFNIVQCTHCGCRNFSGSPFFYEDFEEGLLIAVFPAVPDKRVEMEKSIIAKYGYYPLLDFFYDMTQIWMLLYFQERYKTNRNLRTLSRIGKGEERIRKMLRFLKEDPLMIDIREKITESLFGDDVNDDLQDLLGRAVYTLEGMFPWPLDHRCKCGADLAREFKCCGQKIDLHEHERLLSQHYVIYCPVCKDSLSGVSCEHCGEVYTWRLGTVPSYERETGALRTMLPDRDRERRSSDKLNVP